MAFVKRTWKDRISQYPNRRTINDGNVTKVVTVGRDEGTITESGDAFNASNMNDLESRIENALSGSSDPSTKMDKDNPTGTGSFSMNRASGTTVGYNSVTLGNVGTASGDYSYAEGSLCVASGDYTHAEGFQTTASGTTSHAEGCDTVSGGVFSHAEGYGTIANGSSQHTGGKYNVADNNNAYAEIIGNGSDNSHRSNARTLDWNGNETLSGDLTINGNQSITSAFEEINAALSNLMTENDAHTVWNNA